VSPTLYANALGTVTLKVHAGDTVTKGTFGGARQSRLTARFSQEQATLAGLKVDWQRATLDANQKLTQLREALINTGWIGKPRSASAPQPQA